MPTHRAFCGSPRHDGFISFPAPALAGNLLRFALFALILFAPAAVAVLAATPATPPTSSKRSSDAALPKPGAYQVDPAHSFVSFAAWHHIVGVVRGRFDKVTGAITVAPNPADCAVDIAIDPATISTQVAKRDEDLRGPDFFDVKNSAAVTYRGRGIHREGGSWVMNGDLMIRGIRHPVPLHFVYKGAFPDTAPNEPVRVAFHATAGTHRGDFGMTRDNAMELGVPPVPGLDVTIEIDVEADAVVKAAGN